MPSYSITVHASGPVFDGTSVPAGMDFVNQATKRLQVTGADWIRIDANAMDRSGRGGTGRAADGLTLYDRSTERVIFGDMVKGQVWWPWLEGTSKRNASTGFRGYHTFRKTRQRLSDHLQEIVKPLVDAYVRQMGG